MSNKFKQMLNNILFLKCIYLTCKPLFKVSLTFLGIVFIIFITKFKLINNST